jgi:hypothetical protein
MSDLDLVVVMALAAAFTVLSLYFSSENMK